MIDRNGECSPARMGITKSWRVPAIRRIRPPYCTEQTEQWWSALVASNQIPRPGYCSESNRNSIVLSAKRDKRMSEEHRYATEKAGGANKPVETGEPVFRDYRLMERLRPIIKTSTAQAIELGSGTAVVSAAVRRPMKGVMSRLSGRSLMSISAAA